MISFDYEREKIIFLEHNQLINFLEQLSYDIIWDYMRLYEIIWDYMRLYEIIWDYMRYEIIWENLGPNLEKNLGRSSPHPNHALQDNYLKNVLYLLYLP